MRRCLCGFVLAIAMTVSAGAKGQDAASETPGEARAAEFVGVEGAVAEDVPGGPLVVGAYGVAWLLLFVYLLRLGRLQGEANQALDDLEKRLSP